MGGPVVPLGKKWTPGHGTDGGFNPAKARAHKKLASKSNAKRSYAYNLIKDESKHPDNLHKSVSLYWLEKALILLDGAQTYALLWCLSQPWPWPSVWLKWTRFMNGFNIDYFSFTRTGAGMGATRSAISVYGEMQNYSLYAAVWGTVPLLLILAYWGGIQKLKMQFRDLQRFRGQLEGYFLLASHILYTPVGLGIVRLFYCEDLTVACDRSLACLGPVHILTMVYCCSIFGVWTVGLIRYTTKSTHVTTVYEDAAIHERFICSKECAYVASLNHEWVVLNMWIFTPFKRNGAYTYSFVFVHKLALLLIFALLRSSTSFQSILFFAQMALWRSYCKGIFRCSSTNWLMTCVQDTLMLNGFFALLKGNNVQNGFTVASAVTQALQYGNTLGAVFVGLVLILSAKNHKRNWPVSMHSTQAILKETQTSRWMENMYRAEDFQIEASTMPKELVNIEELELHISRCWHDRAEARLLVHYLAFCLDQTVDDLMRLHALTHEVSLSRNHFLFEVLDQAAPVIKRRNERMNLADPRFKMVLLKLLAVSSFVGDRKIAKLENWKLDTPRVPSPKWQKPEKAPAIEMESKPGRKLEFGEAEETGSNAKPARATQLDVGPASSKPGPNSSSSFSGRPPAPAAGGAQQIPQLQLPKPAQDARAASSAGTGDIQPMIDATKELLKGVLDGKFVELSFCEKEWKLRIKNWIHNFELEHSRPANNADKKEIREWFVIYQDVKKKLQQQSQKAVAPAARLTGETATSVAPVVAGETATVGGAGPLDGGADKADGGADKAKLQKTGSEPLPSYTPRASGDTPPASADTLPASSQKPPSGEAGMDL
jgi:hypothetical protein